MEKLELEVQTKDKKEVQLNNGEIIHLENEIKTKLKSESKAKFKEEKRSKLNERKKIYLEKEEKTKLKTQSKIGKKALPEKGEKFIYGEHEKTQLIKLNIITIEIEEETSKQKQEDKTILGINKGLENLRQTGIIKQNMKHLKRIPTSILRRKSSFKIIERNLIIIINIKNNKNILFRNIKEINFSSLFYLFFIFLTFSFYSERREKKLLKKEMHREINLVNSFEDKSEKELKKRILNKKINNSENINKMRKNISLTNNIIIYLIIIIFIQIVLPKNNLCFIESKFSNITLKINGTGNQYILDHNNNFERKYYPDIIYINGENQSIIDNIYNFNQTDNIVQLIWYNNIDNCFAIFLDCPSIIEFDLSNFDTSNVTNMGSMFSGCSSLTSLNVSNFDTSKVTTMVSMFNGCSSLTSLNVSNFNTSNVIYMHFMFNDCSSLTSINVSNFDTSKVIDMGNMFAFCSLLSSLNLSNFITSNVTNMGWMFGYCSLLSSLNLSNFDTSNVLYMNDMFNGCSSLSSLNLANFDTSKVTDMSFMFYGCSNLEYINLKNFIENNLLSYGNIFGGALNEVVICLNENNNKIKEAIPFSYIIDCSECGNIKGKKIVNKTGICYDNNNNDILYKYEYEGKYYENCLNGYGYLINDSPNIRCKCNDEECYSCYNISNNEYYEIENDNNTEVY